MDILKELKNSFKSTTEQTTNTVDVKDPSAISVENSATIGIVNAKELDAFTPEPLSKNNVQAFNQEKFCQIMGAIMKNKGLNSSNVAVVMSSEIDKDFSPSLNSDNRNENVLESTFTNKNKRTI